MKRALFIALLSLLPSWAFAANATFDNGTNNFVNGHSLTLSVTHAGTGECDVIYGAAFNSGVVDSVTANGTTLTALQSGFVQSASTYNLYEFAPTSSNPTVIVIHSTNETNGVVGVAGSWSSCGGVDISHATNGGIVNSMSDTFSTITANDTVVGFGGNGGTMTDNWSGTTRQTEGNVNNSKMDDKVVASPGSVSVSYSSSITVQFSILSIALCPSTGCTVVSTAVPAGITNVFTSWW